MFTRITFGSKQASELIIVRYFDYYKQTLGIIGNTHLPYDSIQTKNC